MFEATGNQDLSILQSKFQWIVFGVLIAFFSLFPLFVGLGWLDFFIRTGITLISVLGLGLLTGYCGQISLGQAAFMGVGSFAGAIAVQHGMPFLVALLLSGIVAGCSGLIFGLPALRVKGFYLAISTLAAHYLFWFVLVRYFGGDKGHLVARPNIMGLNLSSEVEIYYIVLVLVLVATFVTKNLVRGKTGRAFVAIKDHDFVAGSLGINDYYYKLLAFFICCFYAGVAGFLWATYAGWATVEHFPIWNAIWYLGMLIVGGLGTIIGIFFGTLFISGLDQISFVLGPLASRVFPAIAETAQSACPLALFSIVLLLFIMYEPRGLAYRWEILKKFLRLFFQHIRLVK